MSRLIIKLEWSRQHRTDTEINAYVKKTEKSVKKTEKSVQKETLVYCQRVFYKGSMHWIICIEYHALNTMSTRNVTLFVNRVSADVIG